MNSEPAYAYTVVFEFNHSYNNIWDPPDMASAALRVALRKGRKKEVLFDGVIIGHNMHCEAITFE